MLFSLMFCSKPGFLPKPLQCSCLPLFLSQQSWSAFIPGAAGHPHSAPREAMLGWSMGESRARAAPTLHICNVLQLPLHRASKGGREEEKQENNSGYLPQTLQLERGRES